MSKVTSSLGVQKIGSARRSQRRINKLLDKNILEYSIPNPYRNCRSNAHLPRNLTRQLSRMDSFSVRSLQNLHFNDPMACDQMSDLLLKMKVAVRRQSEQLSAYITVMAEKQKKYYQKSTDQEEKRNFSEQEDEDLQDSIFMPKSSENSIELMLEMEHYENLPIPQQSEGASMMEDNYEVDKLIFETGQRLLNQIDEPLQYYEG